MYRKFIVAAAAIFTLLLPTHCIADTQVKSSPKIVLITIDGVRTEEVFFGTCPIFHKGKQVFARDLLPNFYSIFVDNGMVIGRDSEMDVSGPTYVSMPGYEEILTGHPTTNCFDNDCRVSLDRSIIDYVARTKHSNNIGIITSWDALCKLNTSDKYVLNCGRSVRQNWNYQDHKDFHAEFSNTDRPDVLTERAAFTYYLNSFPDFLWVSIQDTDNYAHYHSYDGYIKSLQSFDTFLKAFVGILDPNTIVILTTDHGRAKTFWDHRGDPASKKVWMALYGQGIPHSGFVKLGGVITSSSIYTMITHLVKQ